MPYHPYIEDTDQGERTFLTRQVNESQYGLRMSKDFFVSGISTFGGGVRLGGGASFPGGGGFSGSVGFPDGIRDSEDGIGNSGQVLSSTGSGLAWINTSAANVGSATSVGINLNTDDSDQWLVFAGANSGNNALRVNNTIRVNPGRAFVGIGTQDPVEQLHIHQVGSNAPILRIEGISTVPMLDLVSPSTGSSKITFSDDNNAAGSITYDHPHNKMKFMIGTTLSFWVSPNAHLRLFEALEDATGQAGVAGSVFSSTGSKTAWLPQSSIAAGSLANARTIGGVSFDGTANIDLPGVNSAGNQNTSGTAAGLSGNPNITVGDITIGGKLKDGDSNFGTSGQVLSSDGTDTKWINVGSISAGSASSIAVNSNGDDSSQFVTFSEGNSGSQQLRADAGLKYNPNDNALTSGSFIKSGGTSSQFLKADGSVDTNTYLTSAGTPDKIEEGNTSAEVIDTGTNGHFVVTTEGDERLRINSAGNVGIASATPAARLDVYKDFNGLGAGTYAGRVYGLDSGVSETGVRFVTKGTGDLHNASDAYLMHGISNGTTRFVFGANGRIGIGTDDPNSLGRLSVVVPTAGGAGAINVQNHEVGTGKTNIVLRSIDNNGGNWADAEFRAEGYSFKIRTTERFIFGFNGELGLGLPNVPGYSGPNYGTSGQVLKSQGVGAGVTWQNAGMSHSNKTSAYTLTASDNDRLITTTSNITVPSGVFSPANGTTIYNNSASNITITPAGGVTLRLSGSNITGTRTLAQRGVCTILCVASNEFIITGSGLA